MKAAKNAARRNHKYMAFAFYNMLSFDNPFIYCFGM